MSKLFYPENNYNYEYKSVLLAHIVGINFTKEISVQDFNEIQSSYLTELFNKFLNYLDQPNFPIFTKDLIHSEHYVIPSKFTGTIYSICRELEYNEEKYKDINEEIYFIFIRLSKAHAFSNGNKRAAFCTSILFALENNISMYALNRNYNSEIDPILKCIVQKGDCSESKELFFNEFLKNKTELNLDNLVETKF